MGAVGDVEGVVVAAARDDVADAGAVSVPAQEHFPVGVDETEIDQLVSDPGGDGSGVGVGRGHHEGGAAIDAVGDGAAGGLADRLIEGGDADQAAVSVVFLQGGGVSGA